MFSKAYDLLMSDVDYNQIYQVVKPYISYNDFMVDAGCGSGYFLIELLQNEHQAIGIDMDSSMLAIALEKLTSLGLPAKLYEHDLRNPLGAKADVIFMMFDVINYFKGAKRILRNMHTGLNTKGRLIFDVYKEEVLGTYHDFMEINDEPFDYQWEIKTDKHVMIHTLTIQDEKEMVRQYVYPLPYYLNILKDLGFTYDITEGPDIRKHYIIAYKK